MRNLLCAALLFLATPAFANSIAVSISDNSLTADSGDTALITATLYDSDSNVITGSDITLDFHLNGVGKLSTLSTTTSSGVATAVYTAGSSTIRGMIVVKDPANNYAAQIINFTLTP